MCHLCYIRIIFSGQARNFSTACKLCGQINENGLPLTLINRNPRNLEKLRIERKPEGWQLDLPYRAYWHKLSISESVRFLSARVEHNNGRIVAEASTNEYSLQKRLLSLKDLIAAETLGKVLADRLLMVGILEVYSEHKLEETHSEKVKKILGALQDAGIGLSEPDRYMPPAIHRARTADEKPWDTILIE